MPCKKWFTECKHTLETHFQHEKEEKRKKNFSSLSKKEKLPLFSHLHPYNLPRDIRRRKNFRLFFFSSFKKRKKECACRKLNDLICLFVCVFIVLFLHRHFFLFLFPRFMACLVNYFMWKTFLLSSLFLSSVFFFLSSNSALICIDLKEIKQRNFSFPAWNYNCRGISERKGKKLANNNKEKSRVKKH